MKTTITIQESEIPLLGLGTYKLEGASGKKVIEEALQSGYRHIDTAQYYNNEEQVGAAMKSSGIKREDIFLVTKVWPSNFSKSKFIPSVEESLRKLKLPQVDLLLLHWPADDAVNRQATDMLAECLHLGYAGMIGVSNFSIAQITQALKQAPVCCNQVEYHPYVNQQNMLRFIQEHQLLLTAYSPLALGKATQDATILSIAKKYNKTASQVVLRWLLQQKNVVVIPKAGNEKHRIENMQVFDFELAEADMQQIFQLQR